MKPAVLPPADIAPTLADAYREATDDDHKKLWGQFFTSPSIATFMASLLRPLRRRDVRRLGMASAPVST